MRRRRIEFLGFMNDIVAAYRDRLLDRLAGDEQEPHALVAGLHGHFIAVVENDE